jgi:hypothetical protein
MATDTLRSFRQNAVQVRQALALPTTEPGPVNVEGGYFQNAALIERYKRLSIPVRRALNPTDRASFAQTLAAMQTTAGVDAVTLAPIEREWQRLHEELDSTVGLGGGKVPRRQILAGWLEAAAFYDKLERDRAYDRLIDQWGKAAEGIGVQLTEDAARVILLLDESAAAALDEPVILPPPAKTPPPPPEPKEHWWKVLFRKSDTGS